MTDLEKLIAKSEENAVPDSQLNLVDMPEITEEQFMSGHFKYWKPLKKSITIRIDIDNLSWLQSCGTKGYQTKLNEVPLEDMFDEGEVVVEEVITDDTNN